MELISKNQELEDFTNGEYVKIRDSESKVKAAAVPLGIQPLQSNNFLRSELPVCHPFVKWAGGKTQLLEKLDLFIPAHFNRY
jgi:hypothetical protein